MSRLEAFDVSTFKIFYTLIIERRDVAMTTSTAIVLSSAGSFADDDQKTIFEQFTDRLYTKTSRQTTSGGGAFRWTSLPVEDVLVSGLWPVLVRMAELLQIPLGTSSQVTRVTEPVNRYISAGLELLFETPEQAAEQFTVEISAATQKVRTHDVQVLSSIFLEPSARFFGRAVKVTMDELARLEQLRIQISDRNTNVAQDRRFTFLDRSILGSVEFILQRFRLSTSTNWSDQKNASYWAGSQIRQWVENAQASLQDIDALARLSLRLKNLPKDLTSMDDVCVTGNWMTTQLLLSALAIEDLDREHIEQSEISLANEAFEHELDQTIVDRFVQRMRDRNSELDESSERIVRLYADSSCRLLRESCKNHPSSMPHALIRMDLDLMEFDHQRAVIELTEGGDVGRTPLIMRGQLRERIRQAIDWSQLTKDEIKRLVRSGELRIAELASQLDRLNPAVHDCVAKTYLNSDIRELNPDILVDFFRRGLLSDDLSLLERVIDRVGADEVLQMLESLVVVFKQSPDNVLKDEHLRLFLLLVRHASFSVSRELMEREDLREAFCLLVLTIRDQAKRAREKTNLLSEEGLFLAKWRPFYESAIVSEIAVLREDVYAHPDRNDEDVIHDAIIAWNRIAQSSFGKGFAEDCGVETSIFARLLRDLPEESAFRWRFAGQPDLDERWERYAKNQQAFIERFGRLRTKRVKSVVKPEEVLKASSKSPRTKKKTV